MECTNSVLARECQSYRRGRVGLVPFVEGNFCLCNRCPRISRPVESRRYGGKTCTPLYAQGVCGAFGTEIYGFQHAVAVSPPCPPM
ncbi:hypothetical protein KC19_VG012600 [Ceratodon purpureus]|uniref:Uncharacterized protein n=1 Tax=Ceratodon purpureus TaxID=3225 RepID=A0A8T0HKY5_CERPU|nr:hypothetical protein KC19_VG012600 [Ceratodon purpureus]